MRSNIIRVSIALLIIILVGLQFIPSKKNVGTTDTAKDFIKIYNPPKNIAKLFKDACYDCHSNNTKYPWYSHIQPIALLIENHVFKGKKELNFSLFVNYSRRKQKNKIRAMIKQIKNDKMPLKSYLIMHPEARLSYKQKDTLVNWLDSIVY